MRYTSQLWVAGARDPGGDAHRRPGLGPRSPTTKVVRPRGGDHRWVGTATRSRLRFSTWQLSKLVGDRAGGPEGRYPAPSGSTWGDADPATGRSDRLSCNVAVADLAAQIDGATRQDGPRPEAPRSPDPSPGRVRSGPTAHLLAPCWRGRTPRQRISVNLWNESPGSGPTPSVGS